MRTDRDGVVTILGYPDGRYEVVLGDPPMGRAGDVEASGPSGSAAAEDIRDSVGVSPSTGDGLDGLLELTVHAGLAGDDLNEEYVVIRNRSRTRIGIGLWQLCDLSTRCFRFPPGASIGSGRSVIVYTGYGSTDGVSFFMNNDRSVWNGNGDEATLIDPGGHTIVRYVYE